eukprot:TRINITY_DN1255_c0_g1_i1.p1 TRINITY_DN1255_c0_g1~~TRINITY_DN1255_c0_g1_i1.p1  ORF type:complete len:490 (-),score=158.22 TRINITY_DN1255_c0_g1_i1:180-1649(-)
MTEEATPSAPPAPTKYDKLLSDAKRANLRELRLTGAIRISGQDAEDRPVVVFTSSNLPKKPDWEKVLQLFVLTLDPVVKQDYVVVYVHGPNCPSAFWAKNVYGILSRDHKKNLKKLFIIHPTFILNSLISVLMPLISKKFWKKMTKVKCATDVLDDEILRMLPPTTWKDCNMEECKVQGNHLDAVVNFENAYYHKGVVMPSIFTAAIAQIEKAGLESVGIFRQSGSKMAVDSMMERYDCGEAMHIELSALDIDSVSSLLKQWIRELPNPLLTFELSPKFIEAMVEAGDDAEAASANIKAVINQLPETNQFVLCHLVSLLVKIVYNSDVNKMTPENCGIVFGPSVLRIKGETMAQSMANIGHSNALVANMIRYPEVFDSVWKAYEVAVEAASKEVSFSETLDVHSISEGSSLEAEDDERITEEKEGEKVEEKDEEKKVEKEEEKVDEKEEEKEEERVEEESEDKVDENEEEKEEEKEDTKEDKKEDQKED